MQTKTFRLMARSSAMALTLAVMAAAQAHASTVFTVQLGSFESEKEARAQWEKLQNRFPDLFDPLNYASAKVQLPPDDFVYYRTQAGPIGTRSDADNICRRLVVKGFECYVAETAMFTADGEDIKDEAPAAPPTAPKEKETAEAAPPPPPPLPQPEQKSAQQELVDLLEAQDSSVPPPPAALPAPQKPEPLPTAPAAEERSAPKKEKESSFFSSLPWFSSSEEEPQPEPAPESPLPPPATAPVAAAPVASGSTPFQSGQSAYATTPATSPAVPAPMPRSTLSVPPVPVASGDMADLKVAEAVPVPLGEIPSGSAPSLGYNTSQERGLPSQQFMRPTLWAEVSYFTTQDAALGYWRTLRARDNMIPQGLRLRVVKPLRQRGGAERLSLRIGPFDNADIIRRLCSHTTPEKLRCQAMRDVGSAVASQGQPRQRLNPADSYARRQAASVSPFAGAPSSGTGGGTYWLQLGAFPSMAMAQSQWSVLKSAHPAQLSKLHEQIQAPGYSSASRQMYRLRVGPFTDNLEASNLCSTLRNAGSMCLVVSR